MFGNLFISFLVRFFESVFFMNIIDLRLGSILLLNFFLVIYIFVKEGVDIYIVIFEILNCLNSFL